jgi:hypothetical protein
MIHLNATRDKSTARHPRGVHHGQNINRRVDVVAAFQRTHRECGELIEAALHFGGRPDKVVANIATASHVASGAVVLDVHDSKLSFPGFVPPWDQFNGNSKRHNK